MGVFDLDFTSDADPYTESMHSGGRDIAGIRCPALANSGAAIRAEASMDWTPELGDSGATWEEVEDEAGDAIEIAASSSVATRRHINPAKWLSLERRFRLKAVTSAGADANQTSGTINALLVKIKV